jgi:hypothetical protein
MIRQRSATLCMVLALLMAVSGVWAQDSGPDVQGGPDIPAERA